MTKKDRRLRRKREVQNLIDIAKQGKRCKCGATTNLTFHHRNPDKKSFCISVKYTMSLKNMQAEIDKCDLLCRDCHDEVHEMTKVN